MTRRVVPFAVIAVLGLFVQIAVMVVLQRSDVPLMLSTLIAVECAVLHNFFWHERWTWRDRPSCHRSQRLAAFHATNGIVSIAGNVVIGGVLARVSALDLVPRTLTAVALTGVLNFLLADKVAFAAWLPPFLARTARFVRGQWPRTAAIAGAALLIASTALAGPSAQALAQWTQVIAATEARIANSPLTVPSFNRQRVLAGELDVRNVATTVEIEGATLQRWRGAVLIPGTDVDTVLHRLASSLPAQPDVLAARLMWRSGDRMAVYLRLVRRAGITVIYDTEHDVSVRRLSPRVAVSRSVMTRVAEVSGAGTPQERAVATDEDRGFLWKLNAYWWYEETPAGVIAVMETWTLSRDIPAVVRPLAAPVVRRVARESVTSALDGLRARFQAG